MGIAGIVTLALALSPIGPAAQKQAQRWRDAPTAQARLIGAAYARCAVRQNRKAVLAYLADPFGTDDPVKSSKALPWACLNEATDWRSTRPGQLVFSLLLSRGLLFEALYARDHRGRSTALDFSGVPERSYPVAGVDADGTTFRRDYRALMRIGDCTARAAPGLVRALLATEVASEDEERAIAALQGPWTACLPGGRGPTFSTEMIRATLAEPLYRLSGALDGSVTHGD